MRPKRQWLPDPFLLALLATVALASVLPCRGTAARGFAWLTDAAVALLFFLHGARLSGQAVRAGAGHWRLHLTVLASTFVLFPLLGLALRPVAATVLTPELVQGLLFLCIVPSTVQSSIAFTSIARGNVPAAVVSASLSSLVGLLATPLLAAALLDRHGSRSLLDGALDIVLHLLLPFALGHVSRRWTAHFVERHALLVKLCDRGAIVLVVYTAFSAAVVGGLWLHTPIAALAAVLALDTLLLGVVLAVNRWTARRLGFGRADEIAIVFCGSKKSLAAGIPMARVLFAGAAGGLGALVIPLMLFHQIQLMVCTVLAQRYASAAHPHRTATRRRN